MRTGNHPKTRAESRENRYKLILFHATKNARFLEEPGVLNNVSDPTGI